MAHRLGTAAVGIVAGLVLAGVAEGAVVTLDPLGRGWYAADGEANQLAATNNYVVGNIETRDTFRNVFAFDLSSLGASVTVTAAQLSIVTGAGVAVSTSSTTGSPAGSETYGLFEVSTDLATLSAGSGGTAAYADLGSGVTYGSRTYTAADANTTQVIPLDAAFLAYANGHLGGTAVLGGAVTTLDGDANTFEFLFGSTQDAPAANTRLVLTTVVNDTAVVPEPVSVVTLAGVASVVAVTRRRRR